MHRLDQDKGVKISQYSLARFYKDNHIKWLKTKYKYRDEERVDQDALGNKRKEFCEKVLQILGDSSKHIVYMDETSINSWTRLDKAWMPSGDSLAITLPSRLKFSVTLYGAIGKFVRKPCFLVAGSTCKENTVTFLNLLRESVHDPV